MRMKNSTLKSVLLGALLLTSNLAFAVGDEAPAESAPCAEVLIEHLTLAQVQQRMHGGNPLSPTPESWLGQYIAETGAASAVRRFPKGPEFPDQWGEERLVVAVSESSLPAYLKYFKRREILQHLHTPRQGTLYLHFNGKVGSYGQMTGELRATAVNSVLPTVLLSTSEGLRAEKFFSLATVDRTAANLPWTLTNFVPPAPPPPNAGQAAVQPPPPPIHYCAEGGYNSCTHWVGNIPIGDDLVDRYIFPGKVDQYAGGNMDPGPQQKPLENYQHGNPLVKEVWQVPGHKQLWEVLGQYDAQVGGYFASPGWVAHIFAAWVGVDRAPVVFVFVPDHTASIPENLDMQTSPL